MHSTLPHPNPLLLGEGMRQACSFTNEAKLVSSIQFCSFYQAADSCVYVRSTKKEPNRLLELRIAGSMKKI